MAEQNLQSKSSELYSQFWGGTENVLGLMVSTWAGLESSVGQTIGSSAPSCPLPPPPAPCLLHLPLASSTYPLPRPPAPDHDEEPSNTSPRNTGSTEQPLPPPLENMTQAVSDTGRELWWPALSTKDTTVISRVTSVTPLFLNIGTKCSLSSPRFLTKKTSPKQHMAPLSSCPCFLEI